MFMQSIPTRRLIMTYKGKVDQQGEKGGKVDRLATSGCEVDQKIENTSMISFVKLCLCFGAPIPWRKTIKCN